MVFPGEEHLRVQEHDLGSFGVSPFVSRRSLQLTLDLVWLCWLGVFLLFSVGELIFDLFLTSSNNLTATVESNAATEKKKGRKMTVGGQESGDQSFEEVSGQQRGKP